MPHTQLSRLDLNLLIIADRLFETRSVTATAEAVGLSQPAVSRALSRIGAQLGKALMVRDRRGIKLTPFAERLRPRLRSAIVELEHAIDAPEAFEPERASGSFTIASQDYAAFSPLPDVLTGLERDAPDVDVVLVPYREPFEELLESSDVDLVIGPRRSEKAWIRSTLLFTSGWVVVGRRSHPYFEHAGLEEFAAARHVLVSPRGEGRGVVDEALSQREKERRICLRVPDFAAALAVVARSDLLTVVPEALAASAAKILPLRSRRLPFRVPSTHVFASYHVVRTEDPRHTWLRDRALSPHSVRRSRARRP